MKTKTKPSLQEQLEYIVREAARQPIYCPLPRPRPDYRDHFRNLRRHLETAPKPAATIATLLNQDKS